MSKYEKLMNVQQETHATKAQQNNYYKYRNVEQIMQAVKPILKKYNAVIYVSDELVTIGDRFYVKATATFVDYEDGGTISVSAYAREPLTSKTMGESQITGSTSSYARKYCLCGLLLLDDNKVEEKILDPDSQQYLENEDIHPDAETPSAPKEKPQAKGKEAPATESKGKQVEYVRFTNDNRCLLRTKNGYRDVYDIETEGLVYFKGEKKYQKAHSAIQCVLDQRSLAGGK